MGMIYVDTREKPHAIKKILAYFEKKGEEVIRKKLDVGDYMLSLDGKISVDRKQNLAEVAVNLGKDRFRFGKECQRAKDAGVQLVILVEHGGRIKDIEDVRAWQNPRLSISPYALSGPRIYQIMKAFALKYGVQWEFCCKQSTGKRIIEILSRG
ncbi:MAG: ERCC4 domain-containing protein [Clostridia bacterium]|nr:ERCC4 domain-containing protein [Clostridia bacterium]